MSTAFHASINVSDLTQSVAFYRALFGLEPARQKTDYAKFELANPPLILSLIPGRPGAGGNLNHLGLRVTDSPTLVALQHRLEAAGVRTQREEGVECCYSKQTKFWVTDPDRALWEIYVLHEGTDEDGHTPPTATNQAASFAQEVPQERIVWQHRIEQPVPARIPHDDNTLHEVLLEGTANLKPSASNLEALLGEAFRVLRPGGIIRVHGLVGDKPLLGEPLNLPGPAAAVQHVPTESAPVSALLDAGFVDVRYEQFSHKAFFTVAGVRMREILIAARKPGHRPRVARHIAIYLGPLARVTDDYGNDFPRGQRVLVNIHDWQALAKGPAAAQFVLLPPEDQVL